MLQQHNCLTIELPPEVDVEGIYYYVIHALCLTCSILQLLIFFFTLFFVLFYFLSFSCQLFFTFCLFIFFFTAYALICFLYSWSIFQVYFILIWTLNLLILLFILLHCFVFYSYFFTFIFLFLIFRRYCIDSNRKAETIRTDLFSKFRHGDK